MKALFKRKSRFVRLRSKDGAVLASVAAKALPDDPGKRKLMIDRIAATIMAGAAEPATHVVGRQKPLSVEVRLSDGRSFNVLRPGALAHARSGPADVE